MRSSRPAPGLHRQHREPVLRPTRCTLCAALLAVVLPLCLASPAFAQSPSGQVMASTSTVPPAPPVSALPTPAPAEEAQLDSELRISGPAGSVSPGSHRIAVRLLADDQPVEDAEVRLERMTPGGSWLYVTRVLTSADGLGESQVALAKSARLRAVYVGSSTRAPATSREIIVDVLDFRARAVQVAAQQKGKPYRWGATGPDSFDCSGLMVYVFERVGKDLPRTSRQQLDATQRIAKADKQPGDLIFTQRNGRVGHVGVYAGDHKFWVAPKAGDVVKLQTIYTSNYLVGRVR